ncbi:hypothetical protein NDU88_006609 [Pleurodeles waltl]|uniref:Uncharacterized protein n=1 Tax=Pleurodeles waltl TaxID=8319 RepID=A0AAV7PMC7_PLEWA|nr:hypothetical protein NDU88_006609 [Pleurodeles waltl]
MRPQAAVVSPSTASRQLARGTESGRIVRVPDTAHIAGPGQRFKAMPVPKNHQGLRFMLEITLQASSQ